MPSTRKTIFSNNKKQTVTIMPTTARGRATALKISNKAKPARATKNGSAYTVPMNQWERGSGLLSADSRGILKSIARSDRAAKSEGAMKRAATTTRRRKYSAAGVAAQKANRAAYGPKTRKSR